MNTSSIPIYCPVMAVDQHSRPHTAVPGAFEMGIKTKSGVLTESSSHPKLPSTAVQGSFLKHGKNKLQGLAKFASRVVAGLICTAVLSQAAFAVCTNPVVNNLSSNGLGWTPGGAWFYGTAPWGSGYGNTVDNGGTQDLTTTTSDVADNPILAFSFSAHLGGSTSRMAVWYGGVQYASINTGGSPVTTMNGASCVSGCGSLPPDTYSPIQLRLPGGLTSAGIIKVQAI